MSAIAGILSLGPEPVEAEPAERMASELAWRGPDDDGSYRSPDGRIALAAHRLAVVDRSAGAGLPLANETHDVWLVLDGEIVNHRPLRHSLELTGHRFRSNSDAEVAIHAYEQWGMDFLRHLQGGFALALWDDRRDRLVLARDKLGRKPLYMGRHRGMLAFASAVGPVLSALGLPRLLDPQGLAIHLALGFVPAPRTVAAGIEKIPPGEMLLCERGREPRRAPWGSCLPDDRRAVSVRALASDTHAGNLRTLLECSVADRLMGDGPVGAILSPGAEWGAIAAVMGRLTGTRPRAVATVDAVSPDGEPAREMRAMAAALRADLAEVRVGIDDVCRALPGMAGALAEPVTDERGPAAWFAAHAGAQAGLFALLGADGADEVLLGHPAYQPVRQSGLKRRLGRWVPAKLLARWGRGGGPRPSASVIPDSLTPFPDGTGAEVEVPGSGVLPDITLTTPRIPDWTEGDALEALGLADLQWRVAEAITARADCAAQAHGIESRLPFLDEPLVAYALAVPGMLRSPSGAPRQILKRSLSGLVPHPSAGRAIQLEPLPLGAWMAGALGTRLADHLTTAPLVRSGALSAPRVRAMLARHRADGSRARNLWALLILLEWCKAHGFAELAPLPAEPTAKFAAYSRS